MPSTLAAVTTDDIGAVPHSAEPSIRREHRNDHPAVRALHLAAFEGDEHVPALADALRRAEAPLAPMSFVATVEGQVAGHVLLSAGRLDAPRRIVDVLVLSPLGVLPQFQNQGIGTRLIEHALAAADAQHAPLVFLEGSPRYYAKRGFERADTIGFRSPSLRIPPPAFQVARLAAHEPWMTGTLVYSDTFWALDCVGLRDTEASTG
ncbi:GNAT family N-acetyltransferase [Streptomyces sp. NEAU-S7GS2]|nr:GNAT family N-acetyltransferase [Streptomyces sp. NEAU-S7GS2]